ncbi:hypothetical protein BJF93_07690 [Xaviernesmea oryzae]|uniref:Lipoprotein n=1 Tax=Xaviernesmea oryzae TaxID=464029 RepID=A0A1Q9B1U4_9HYPH|nr:hypothetical protein [Xaviernesmea oryzae]OLP61995.1 hypothetical protein BJF93_07690 [Xaviernesmea oryzae]SEK97814.1 Predicted lipoprotein with conserved Yx(FWY)xxD motif [Xaviernesmea oryzae]
MLIRSLLLAGLMAAATLSPAHAEDEAGGAIKTRDTGKGEVLTDAKGMTLYTFDKDTGGTSACDGDCAKKWPPLLAAKGAKDDGEFTLVKRKDGKQQWAHEGSPLYLWINDKKPGDTTGDGVGGVWHVAKD